MKSRVGIQIELNFVYNKRVTHSLLSVSQMTTLRNLPRQNIYDSHHRAQAKIMHRHTADIMQPFDRHGKHVAFPFLVQLSARLLAFDVSKCCM